MNLARAHVPDNSYESELVSLIDTASFNKKSICFNPNDIEDLVHAAKTINTKVKHIEPLFTNTNASEADIHVPPIIYLKRENLRGKPFVSLQKWEGVVTEVNTTNFHAKLADFNYQIDEVAEISLEEVLPEDIELVKPGAVFYWSIGYSDPNGTRVRSSIILFRRMPKTSDKQFQEADKRAMEVRKLLGLA